jgi:hypothetical protein
MLSLIVFWLVVIMLVGMTVVPNVMEKKTGVSTQRRITRRRIVRDIRRNHEKRPRLLLHLTEEQWQSHAKAFADYCCGMGKYHNFTGLIPQWLESEGLPSTPYRVSLNEIDPLVCLRDFSGNRTGWSCYLGSTGEVTIYGSRGEFMTGRFTK